MEMGFSSVLVNHTAENGFVLDIELVCISKKYSFNLSKSWGSGFQNKYYNVLWMEIRLFSIFVENIALI